MLRDWTILFVVGYLKWFVLVPRLWSYMAGLLQST